MLSIADVVKRNINKIQGAEKAKKDGEKTSESIEETIHLAKKRIGIQPVTLDDIDRIAEQEKVIGKEALKLAVK